MCPTKAWTPSQHQFCQADFFSHHPLSLQPSPHFIFTCRKASPTCFPLVTLWYHLLLSDWLSSEDFLSFSYLSWVVTTEDQISFRFGIKQSGREFLINNEFKGTLSPNKNDDSVKEAPAYCQSFLDGLYNTKEVGDGAKPLLWRFTMFSRGL